MTACAVASPARALPPSPTTFNNLMSQQQRPVVPRKSGLPDLHPPSGARRPATTLAPRCADSSGPVPRRPADRRRHRGARRQAPASITATGGRLTGADAALVPDADPRRLTPTAKRPPTCARSPPRRSSSWTPCASPDVSTGLWEPRAGRHRRATSTGIEADYPRPRQSSSPSTRTARSTDPRDRRAHQPASQPRRDYGLLVHLPPLGGCRVIPSSTWREAGRPRTSPRRSATCVHQGRRWRAASSARRPCRGPRGLPGRDADRRQDPQGHGPGPRQAGPTPTPTPVCPKSPTPRCRCSPSTACHSPALSAHRGRRLRTRRRAAASPAASAWRVAAHLRRTPQEIGSALTYNRRYLLAA